MTQCVIYLEADQIFLYISFISQYTQNAKNIKILPFSAGALTRLKYRYYAQYIVICIRTSIARI